MPRYDEFGWVTSIDPTDALYRGMYTSELEQWRLTSTIPALKSFSTQAWLALDYALHYSNNPVTLLAIVAGDAQWSGCPVVCKRPTSPFEVRILAPSKLIIVSAVELDADAIRAQLTETRLRFRQAPRKIGVGGSMMNWYRWTSNGVHETLPAQPLYEGEQLEGMKLWIRDNQECEVFFPLEGTVAHLFGSMDDLWADTRTDEDDPNTARWTPEFEKQVIALFARD